MTFFRKIIVAEKNNFSSNASHNSAMGKVIPKCKNYKNLKKLNRKSASPPPPPHPFKKRAPAPFLDLFFLIFRIPPLRER